MVSCNGPFNISLQLQGKAPLSVVPRASEQANKNRQGWLNYRPAEVSLTQLLMFRSASACLPSRGFSLWQRRVLPPVTQLARLKQGDKAQRGTPQRPREADNIQRGCSTIFMTDSVCTWLEVSAQGKVRSKCWLDGSMRRTWQCSAQSNRWVTSHLHSVMTPPRTSYLPVDPPFPSPWCSAKFFVLHTPHSADKKTALQQGWRQRRIVSLHCWCQGQASWRTRNHLSSILWQAKWAALGSITHRPVDIHHGLDAPFPEDGASHEGHPCLSLCS